MSRLWSPSVCPSVDNVGGMWSHSAKVEPETERSKTGSINLLTVGVGVTKWVIDTYRFLALAMLTPERTWPTERRRVSLAWQRNTNFQECCLKKSLARKAGRIPTTTFFSQPHAHLSSCSGRRAHSKLTDWPRIRDAAGHLTSFRPLCQCSNSFEIVLHPHACTVYTRQRGVVI